MIYAKSGQDLFLQQEGAEQPAVNKGFIVPIARGFNILLQTGVYSQDWEPVLPDSLQ